ncbi:unnamed protein product [Rhizoctonia solani]|uniref:Uncharacterized protein n=1 Tax=Rhizoctonia solani TaxID=456999 RepID=A0A8H2WRG2_9AGAM|nr:unnamed protein product [Rhizoctonia solani]
MVASFGRSVGPISTLPEGVSKLLRADAIFSTAPGDGAKLYFYPHHFRDFSGSTHNVYYHSKASEIAQALLGALGLPDASYLALRAEAETFRCGRCPPAAAMRMGWKQLIQHYIDSIRLWERISQAPRTESNNEYVYICTHDINSDKAGRPLAHLGGNPTGRSPWYTSTCIPCERLGLNASESRQCQQAMADHLRDAHLIEVPESGGVYRYHY